MDGWNMIRLPFGMALGHVHVHHPNCSPSAFTAELQAVEKTPCLWPSNPRNQHSRSEEAMPQRVRHKTWTSKQNCGKKNVVLKNRTFGKWFHDTALSMFGNCWNLLNEKNIPKGFQTVGSHPIYRCILHQSSLYSQVIRPNRNISPNLYRFSWK